MESAVLSAVLICVLLAAALAVIGVAVGRILDALTKQRDRERAEREAARERRLSYLEGPLLQNQELLLRIRKEREEDPEEAFFSDRESFRRPESSATPSSNRRKDPIYDDYESSYDYGTSSFDYGGGDSFDTFGGGGSFGGGGGSI